MDCCEIASNILPVTGKKPKQIAEAKIGINSTNKNIINNKQKDISYRTNSTNKNIKWWTTVVVTSGLSEFLSSLS